MESRFRDMIRRVGLRATRPRISVLRLLHQVDGPRSHAQVTEALRQADWDRATLYRNLTDMVEAGLLRRVDLGDHVWRFELASRPHDDGEPDHPHFLCTQCGDVTCLPELPLPSAGDLPRSVLEGSVTIQLRGICDGCVEI